MPSSGTPDDAQTSGVTGEAPWLVGATASEAVRFRSLAMVVQIHLSPYGLNLACAILRTVLALKCWHTLGRWPRVLEFDSQKRPMARFRIVRRPSCVQAGVPIYDVEERCWLWWEFRGTFTTVDEAERRAHSLIGATPISRMVIKEYD
jgi:hypothetical protein